MNKIIDEKSVGTVPEGINYFNLPATNVGIIDSGYVAVAPVNAISNEGPYEFRYWNDKHYLQLNRTYISITCSIRDENGKVIPAQFKAADDSVKENPPYAPIQMLAKTFFRQYMVYLNATLISDSSVNAAFRAHLMNELSYDRETKRTVLGMAGYSHDDQPDSAASAGNKERVQWARGGATMQFFASIDQDFFTQPRFLPSFIDMRLVAFRNEDAFVIEQLELPGDKTKYQLRVDDVRLWLYQVELHDSVVLAIEKVWKDREILPMPMRTIALRTFYIAAGRFDLPLNVLFTSHTPRRVVCALVGAKRYQGDYHSTPFLYEHFNVNEISIEVAGRQIPARGMKLDFAHNRFQQAYMSMVETMGVGRSNSNNGISPKEFKEHSTIFCFEVIPQVADQFSVVNIGTTSIRMSFAKAIPAPGCYLVCLGEFDNMLSIRHDRCAIIETIV